MDNIGVKHGIVQVQHFPPYDVMDNIKVKHRIVLVQHFPPYDTNFLMTFSFC